MFAVRSAGDRGSACALRDLGIVCNLGSTLEPIWQRLTAGDQSAFTQREDLVSGGSWWFGAIRDELPEIADSHSAYRCRNNQLALAAYRAIEESVESVKAQVGANRIGVVVGSSTAGIAEAEAAFHARAKTGRLTPTFQLVQLEFGGLRGFLEEVSGARGPCFTLSSASSRPMASWLSGPWRRISRIP
jgi:3-oxoacyl-[acyl-carrier-protein] synthase-1